MHDVMVCGTEGDHVTYGVYLISLAYAAPPNISSNVE